MVVLQQRIPAVQHLERMLNRLHVRVERASVAGAAGADDVVELDHHQVPQQRGKQQRAVLPVRLAPDLGRLCA